MQQQLYQFFVDKANNLLLNNDQLANNAKIFANWHSMLQTHSKTEEQLQADFLNDIFGEVLGYAYKRGKSEINLEKEQKTELDGQKPDGVLGFFTETSKDYRVIIELKDSKTNLDAKQKRKNDNRSAVEQAFGYVAKYQGIEFVIVSNFNEIRLYKSNYQGKYQAFTMQELANNENKQREFHFLLAKDRLFTKQHQQSPVHSLNNENQGIEIERKFYAHYSALRYEIWQNLIALNQSQKYGRNFYLYKAQKLIDRIIFIRFCKENRALDNDAVLDALNNKYTKGRYNRLKLLFAAMDEGNPEIGIAKFNGGLFSPDSDLDILNISDEIIDKIVLLYSHDFGSDLDVNILGHIFEQSISDLENLTGDQQQQRKKDGVFYTPAYITQYIVQEAIGGWLVDKQTQIKAKQHSQEWWQQYASILKSIKVVDPACGSGAFLVKVFDYLQQQWQQVAKHININYSYHDILTNNIYGVDINPASVGITKLSLWLKTAHHRQPLTTLDNNIKIGNSLIDDPDIAGYYSEFEGKVIQEIIAEDLLNHERIKQIQRDGIKKSLAFKWKEEFEQVFATGGFDVVVGNPPYVFARGGNFNDETKDYYYKNYKFIDYQINTYLLFIEQGYKMLDNGRLGFIIPNNWLTINTFVNLRKFILEQTSNTLIINTFGNVFEGASVDSCILTFAKDKTGQEITLGKMIYGKIEASVFNKNEIAIGDDKVININQASNRNGFEIIKKINENSVELDTVANVLSGLKAYETGKGEPRQNDDIKNSRVYHSKEKHNDTYIKYLEGSDVSRYSLTWSGEYLSYGKWLAAPRFSAKFKEDRILVRQIPSKLPYAINAIFTKEEFINDINSMIIQDLKVNPMFILAILNCKLTSFWFDITLNKFSRTIFPQFKINELKKFPIPQIPLSSQQPFIVHAQAMLDLNKQLNDLSSKFLKLLSADLGITKISKKLEKWHSLNTNEFFAEVGKQNKALSLANKSQWLEHFETQQQQAIALQKQITCTDNEIDKMVYALYQLSEEEIAVIENHSKD